MARRLSKNGAGAEKPKTRKPRAANGPSSAAPVSNVTDDTIRELCLDALDKKNAHEEAVKEAKAANAEYRAVLKKAKKLGVLPEAIIVWLNDRKLEIADVSNRIAQQNRIYKCMKLPVGTQLGLWESGETIATAIENDSGDDGIGDASAAFDKGHESALAGLPIEKTGYNEDHKHWLEFLRGRSAGTKEAATRPGGLADGASAH